MAEAFGMLVNLASSALSRSFSSLTSSKSHPSFDDGAVGLAIVAAMVGEESPPPPPLHVFSTSQAVSSILNLEKQEEEAEEEASSEEFSQGGDEMEISDEMWESYTCVTSYVEGKPVSKTVYLDDGGTKFTAFDNAHVPMPSISNSRTMPPISNSGSKAVFFVGSPQSPPLLATEDGFMESCFLCDKSLDGIDIFMYRGEKSFCSPECRYEYILDDDHPERVEVLKLLDADSPSSTPRPLGMTAAQHSSSSYLPQQHDWYKPWREREHNAVQ